MSDFVASTPMALAFLLFAVLVLLGIGVSGLRHRLLFLMGLRNMWRRPFQAVLLLVGLIISTVLIVASFGLNDSLTYSAQQQIIQETGHFDDSITGTFSQAQLDHYLSVLRQHPGVQSVSGLATIVGGYHGNFMQLISERTRISLAINYLFGVAPDLDQSYGPFTDQQGQVLHASDLRAGDAYVSLSFALNNDVRVGDQLKLSLGDRTAIVTLRGILANDIAMTAEDANSIPKIELVVPMSTAHYIMNTSQPINLIGVRQQALEHGSTPYNQVEHFLSQLFGVPLPDPNPHTSQPPSLIHPTIHPLKTGAVERASSLSFTLLLGGDSLLQFNQLVPAISLLLVGAGMLLLALLFVLLAAERRAELGMSRAIGLQRTHLVLLLLIEGGGYGCIAALLGLPVGVAVIALELMALSHFPVNILGSLKGLPMALHVFVSWQSLVSAFCLSLLVTFAVLFVIAVVLSRTNIVAAIRDLDEPPAAPPGMLHLLHRVKTHQPDALVKLVGGLFLRGPLCLLAGLLLIALSSSTPQNVPDLSQALVKLGWGLVIASCGLLLRWLFFTLSAFPASFARRLGNNLIGTGWLAYGLTTSARLFSLFQPTGTMINVDSVAFDLALTMILFVAGSVLIVTTNVDLLVALLTSVMSRMRPLAPISRISLSYPLTYRFRMAITLTELSLVVFLIVLIITMNVGAIDASQAAISTGGFQLSGISTKTITNLSAQVQRDSLLNHDIQVVAPVHRYRPDTPDGEHPDPVLVSLPGQGSQVCALQPMVEDDTFYANTNFPLQARAQGYGSDRQVWNALTHQPNTAVMRFDSSVKGLPTGTFSPFTAQLPDAQHRYHQLTVIGIVSAAAQWPFFYLSVATATVINGGPAQQAQQDRNGLGYLFKVRPGVDLAQASRDLSERFAPTYGLQVQQLYDSTQATTQSNMTLFLGSALILGLLFGALAIGVITSRAVIERRQQIGMLRALGFSRRLVARSFLLEAGFVITLSLLVGTVLALWIANQIISITYPAFLIPVVPLALILIGSYLIAFLATTFPARAASRVQPAEALRYE